MEIVVHWTLLDAALKVNGVYKIFLFYMKDGKHKFIKMNHEKVKEYLSNNRDTNYACNNG